MPRALTSAMLRQLSAQESDDVALVLLTLSRADWGDATRLVADEEEVTSRGQLFMPYAFTFLLPTDGDEAPTAKLVVDNVARDLVDNVWAVTGPVSVMLEIVLASAPDTLVTSWTGFEMRAITGDSSQISGELAFENLREQRFPKGRFYPSNFPGLF